MDEENFTIQDLFQFEQSKKPMTLDLALGEEALRPIKAELQKIDEAIYLPVIGASRDVSCDSAKPFILQR